MKKILCFAVALITVVSMIGCSKDEKEPVATTASEKAVSTTAKSETTAKTEEVTTENNEPVTEQGITVTTENYMNGQCSVTLMYPVYSDEEHSLFDAAMRNYAVQKMNEQGLMPEDSAVYEVTGCDIRFESEEFVSAVVTGVLINTTSAHDSMFAYVVNADPRNGRIYLPDELIGNVETIKTAMADDKFTMAYGVEGLMDTATSEEITGSWRSDYGIFPDVYFTTDGFGVMAELPHVLGDYAGFEIPYSDAEGMMNASAKELVGITD